ncbi:MAG: hypothetical protein ABIQ90_07335 [Polaromonas sp.]
MVDDSNIPNQPSVDAESVVGTLNKLRDEFVQLSLFLHDYMFQLEMQKSQVLGQLSNEVIEKARRIAE